MEIAGEEVGSKLPVIHGIWADGSLEAARIARQAPAGGASALLVFPPAPFTMGQTAEMALAHFKRIADASDLPIAGLLTDLKARGLLDSTLVIWHGEFGRMPISQRGVGRDHNPGAQTVWMAGAGIKGGQVIGSTDDFGYKAAEQPTSIHDLHATMLHLLGMDHTKLTYRFNGRDMRLTDVGGELIPQIVA